ncbi:MAG: hypothetical protein AAB453_02270 [Patescibacteria group bacterium]
MRTTNWLLGIMVALTMVLSGGQKVEATPFGFNLWSQADLDGDRGSAGISGDFMPTNIGTNFSLYTMYKKGEDVPSIHFDANFYGDIRPIEPGAQPFDQRGHSGFSYSETSVHFNQVPGEPDWEVLFFEPLRIQGDIYASFYDFGGGGKGLTVGGPSLYGDISSHLTVNSILGSSLEVTPNFNVQEVYDDGELSSIYYNFNGHFHGVIDPSAYSISAVVVPEPVTWLITGVGTAIVYLGRKKKEQKENKIA